MPPPFFLNSEEHGEGRESQFEALGHAGSSTYVGLETFLNPGCGIVIYTSDEVMASCPITGQPDFYTVAIQLRDTEKLIESKSLKLWYQNLMAQSLGESGHGIFCEALTVHIRNTIAEVLGCDEEQVTVQLDQKARGGITIRAIA